MTISRAATCASPSAGNHGSAPRQGVAMDGFVVTSDASTLSLYRRDTMALALRNNTNKLSRDPYSFTRDLFFGWDPFFGGREPSAFMPTFEVKETNEAFLIKADLPGVDEK